MLNHEDDLLQLVGNIHAAADDPNPHAWNDALQRIGDAFGGAGVLMTDHRMPDTFVTIEEGRLPPQIGEYIAINYNIPDSNPITSNLNLLPIRIAMHPEEFMGHANYQKQGIYQEVLRPLGFYDYLFTLLYWDGDRSILMYLSRPTRYGSLGKSEERLLERLIPHIKSAALLRSRVADLFAPSDGPRQALDALEWAIFLVDAAGRLIYANRAAARVLDRRDGLTADRDGIMRGARPEVTSCLRQLIASALAASDGRGLQAGGALRLPRPGGRSYIVQVLPLAASAELDAVPHRTLRPAAMLVMRDPDKRSTPSPTLLQQAYDLTPAEAALTAQLVSGASPQQATAALGISPNTAKSQLKATFAKLEVDRQAVLVQRVLSELDGGLVPARHKYGNAHAR